MYASNPSDSLAALTEKISLESSQVKKHHACSSLALRSLPSSSPLLPRGVISSVPSFVSSQRQHALFKTLRENQYPISLARLPQSLNMCVSSARGRGREGGRVCEGAKVRKKGRLRTEERAQHGTAAGRPKVYNQNVGAAGRFVRQIGGMMRHSRTARLSLCY